jgi:hypothetical protein
MGSGTDFSALGFILLQVLPYSFLFCYSIYLFQRGLDDETSIKNSSAIGAHDFNKHVTHDKIEGETLDINYGPKKGHLQLIYGGKVDPSNEEAESLKKNAG